MKYLKYVLFTMIAVLSACITNKNIENCKIKKVLEFTVMSENSYYMNIIFYDCKMKESREELVKQEIYNKYPSIKNKKIQVQEYLGKFYNQYKYIIKVG